MSESNDDALIPRPKSLAELQARPNFRAMLDPKAHQLRRVRTDYDFDQLVACGLSGCRQGHKIGFLVETTDGFETLMGHVCARNTFGEAVWDVASAAYRRERELADLLARAASIKEGSGDIERKVEAVFSEHHGVRWVRDVRAALQAILGQGLCDSLARDHKTGELDVKRAQRRSEEEIDRLAEASKRPRANFLTETVTIGRLASAEWLTFRFTECLRDELQVPLAEFVGLDHTVLATPELRRRVRQFDNWEKRFVDARTAAATAVAFLEEDNLRLLMLWIPERMSSRRAALGEWIISSQRAELLA